MGRVHRDCRRFQYSLEKLHEVWFDRPENTLWYRLWRRFGTSLVGPEVVEDSVIETVLRGVLIAFKRNSFFFYTILPEYVRTNPARFWNSILYGEARQIRPLLILNEEPVDDTEVINESFNAYFQSVFTLEYRLVPEFSTDVPSSELEDIHVTVRSVLKLLLNLDAKKRKGCEPNKVSNAFLIRYPHWCAM